MRDEWREIIAAAIEREADEILDEVNSDPSLKDVQAPEEIHDKLFEQIREYEKQKIYDQLTEEDRELIQLGKVYKKKRTIGRYIVVALAVVAVLALGSVSMGEGESIPEVISRIFAGREQMVTDSGETDVCKYDNEAEIYEKLEELYDFCPVRIEYLPEHIVYQEASLGKEIQYANIIYGVNNNANIIYIIRPNYRKHSYGIDIEDEKICEYQLLVQGVEIILTKYLIEDSGEQKWSAHFVYDDVQYLLRMTGIEQGEVEKIVNNLHFIQ